jgi:polar amino acid transport system substrate-binding protein
VQLSVVPQGAQPYNGQLSKSQCQTESGPTNNLTGPLPAAGQMPSGSFMAQIAQRGHLKVGIDQNSFLWGYRRSASSDPEGFDINMVQQVAKAIFGPSYSHHITYVVVPNADRIQDVQSGQVDIVAETMTITPAREKCVNFSSVYYDAHQEVLVPKSSPITSTRGLADRRVCASAKSTSITNVLGLNLKPPPQMWQVTNQTDCLVMLQQGQVDAISTDDTILEGLAAQDPQVKILPLQLFIEPYGMAISKAHPDFKWFVDGVLAEEKNPATCTADDSQPEPLCWTAIWNHWLQPTLHVPTPTPPSANEGL